MGLRPVAFDVDDRIGEQHVVARAARVACRSAAIQFFDLRTPVGDRAVDVEHRILGEVLRHLVSPAHRKVVVIPNQQIFDLDTVEERFHGHLLR
jgi:hypothetical protein